MKKIIVLSFCLVMVFASVSSALLGLTGSKHQMGTEICVACHTPHAAVASTNGPLWNRTQAGQVYTYYTNVTSSTFDMGASTLGTQSLACMTCHNGIGSTIVNGPGSGVGNTAPYALGASGNNSIGTNQFSNIGTDLTNDHPVGFTYVPGSDLQNNSFPAIAANGKIGTTNMPTFAGKIECATCHDVHNQSYNNTAVEVQFLRQTTVASAMCLACHTTK